MNSEKYDVRRDAQKSCSFFLSFFLHADFLFSLGIPYHNIDCVSLSLYFDLSLSLFLLALNIFDNHFWITKRLWICALFRFVRCISIWGSKLAYNCLHSLADIPKMCKKSLQKKNYAYWRWMYMCQRNVLSKLHACAKCEFETCLIVEWTWCSVHVYARRFESERALVANFWKITVITQAVNVIKWRNNQPKIS